MTFMDDSDHDGVDLDSSESGSFYDRHGLENAHKSQQVALQPGDSMMESQLNQTGEVGTRMGHGN